MTTGTVAFEFPDFDDKLPEIEGFTDSSWHNDTAPSLTNEELHLQLFVDFIDPALSEYPEERASGNFKRYALHRLDDENMVTDDPLILFTDDFNEVLATIELCRETSAPKA